MDDRRRGRVLARDDREADLASAPVQFRVFASPPRDSGAITMITNTNRLLIRKLTEDGRDTVVWCPR